MPPRNGTRMIAGTNCTTAASPAREAPPMSYA